MDTMHFEPQKKKKGFWDNQGFYLAVALCLLAVGASSWAALRQLDETDRTAENLSSVTASVQTAVDKIISNVPAPREPESVTPSITDSASETPAPEPSSETTIVEQEPSSSAPEPTSAAPFFILPTGGQIRKGFDADHLQYDETYKDWRLHTALDIEAEKGTPVVAAAAGRVTDVKEDPLYGTVVTIDHGGIIARYCGLNKAPAVQPGDEVEAGQQIGAVDTVPCESVEATHLHFATERDGIPLSPLELIDPND